MRTQRQQLPSPLWGGVRGGGREALIASMIQMRAMSDSTSFADVFPAATEAQWRARVDAVLKGAPFEKLQGRSYDGLTISPLYTRLLEDRPRAVKAGEPGWARLARVDNPDPAGANKQALADLENGATGLHLVCAGSMGAYGFGLPAGRQALEQALEGVALDVGLAFELDLSPQSIDSARHLADLIAEAGGDGANVTFGHDPLGQMAISSVANADLAAAAKLAMAFNGRAFVADGRAVNGAGGSEAQELAFVVASALAYLRALEGVGADLSVARGKIGFRLSADADEILGVAKLRALRRLWARVEEACGLTAAPIHIHAETSFRMMSRRDPWVNILRATVACFSAGLGGADAVTVLPFTQALGLPDDFARRIARNTQAVLLEESSLGRVADPAAGAGSFETLTDALCEAAWALVQETEKASGLHNALASGAFQAKVATVQAARARAIAHRKDPITGTSEFPNIAEAPVEVLAPMPAAAPASALALAPHRDAQAFEALRDRADAQAAEKGARRSVFLANLGPIAAFTARSMFAKNFFEAGGIVAPGNEGFADEASLAEAFKASGAAFACICSSDPVYEDWGQKAARALAKAGARHIYLAGRPGAAEAAWKEAGVSGFIFAGCDVVAVLDEALRLA